MGARSAVGADRPDRVTLMATPTTDTTAGRTRRADRLRPDAYEIATTRVLEHLAEGTVPWKRPWTATAGDGLPRNLATGRPYRGVNVLLLWMAGYGSPWWLTYKQARSLDGQVRKGERSTPIVVWKQTTRILNTPAKLAKARAEKRRITTDRQGRPVCTIVLSRVYRGFNAEQIDGLDGHPDLQPAEDEGWDPHEACESTVAGYRHPPVVTIGGERASYDPRRDRVRMPDRGRFESALDWYGTLFHELGHSTGHGTRLNRPDLVDGPDFGSTGYAREELTAEMTAAMLCTHCRIDTPDSLGQHAAYLDHWRRTIDADPKLVVLAAQRAQHACDHILGTAPSTADDAEGASAEH